jgi:preprotein translocase subunit SecA
MSATPVNMPPPDDEFVEKGYKYDLYFDPKQAIPVTAPLRRKSPKVGRNELCVCGSGKKSKRCCGG